MRCAGSEAMGGRAGFLFDVRFCGNRMRTERINVVFYLIYENNASRPIRCRVMQCYASERSMSCGAVVESVARGQEGQSGRRSLGVHFREFRMCMSHELVLFGERWPG